MSGKWGRMFAGVMIALPLGACITMQKKEDGKNHISIPNPLAELLKGEEGDSRGGTSVGTAMQDGRQAAQTAAGGYYAPQTSANGNDSGSVEEPKNQRSASARNGRSSDDASPRAPAGVEGKTAKMQRKQSSQEKRASLLIQNAIKCNNPESMEELDAYLQNTAKYKMDGTPLPLSL